jgi:hypothetical protein
MLHVLIPNEASTPTLVAKKGLKERKKQTNKLTKKETKNCCMGTE